MDETYPICEVVYEVRLGREFTKQFVRHVHALFAGVGIDLGFSLFDHLIFPSY